MVFRIGWGAVVVGAVMAAGAARAAPLELDVAGAGEVVAEGVGEATLWPGNLAGVTGVTTAKVIHPGHQIEGGYCRQFGFSFRARNLTGDQTAPIMIQVTHPTWTLPDGRTGTTETWTSVLQGRSWGYVGYAFTEAWSLVPGVWSFTVSQDGRVLTRQDFELQVAPGQTMPPDGCTPQVS